MNWPAAPGAPRSQLNDREWDKLINLIAEGNVVPVVGPELLVVNDPSGAAVRLYDVWGQVLGEQADLAPPAPGAPAASLYSVTNQLSQVQNGSDLAYDIDDVVRRRPWPVPDSLRQLAGIARFPLVITTTVDHLYKQAFDEARAGRGLGLQEIFFTPRGAKTRIDLPENFGFGGSRTLFHLFGATASVEGAFAKTEDDLIEFSWSLLDQQYAPDRLYDYLRQKTILLLGCNFPDWLGRFFLHALGAGRHDTALNIYYVSGGSEPGLDAFLKRRRAKIILPQSPSAFVAELHRRWRAAGYTEEVADEPEPEPAPADTPATTASFKRGAVFLSYCKEDRDAVAGIRAQLEAANIDTWMDENALEPGDEFQRVIHENIRGASFFVAVISRSLDNPDKPSRFIWREWKWAEDINLERRKDDRYLQPLVIDTTPPGASYIDPPFRDLHWTIRGGDGRLSDDFVAFLSQGIRRFRRTR